VARSDITSGWYSDNSNKGPAFNNNNNNNNNHEDIHSAVNMAEPL